MPLRLDKRTAAEAVNSRGYALFPDVDGTELLELATRLGVPTSDTRSEGIVKDLHPQESQSSPHNTLSARFGTGAFPLHTETAYWRNPARYVLLHCVSPGTGGRPTLLVDVTPNLGDAARDALRDSMWIVGRTRRPFLVNVLESAGSGLRLRFDPECMSPAEKPAERALQLLDAFLATQPAISIGWRHGDLLILDNHRVVHGRGSSETPDPDRHLRRVLVAES
jgi:L-asparagine oxygenase